MISIQTDALDTAGGVFMAVAGLGCACFGGLAVLRPGSPPKPFEGPAWVVRAWGFGYVLLGLGTAARMGLMLVGKEPARLTAVTHSVATPLLICSVTAAYVVRRRRRRPAGTAAVGRHK
ncbi:hypothetical protein GCM10010415_70720 [Streptomyces atrovirens]|uniref:DUF4345 domain-containing protein n=1 Tax=Streptomyces atrovirens TaxID=285556 RepID=A0ABW0DXL3_9ACTN